MRIRSEIGGFSQTTVRRTWLAGWIVRWNDGNMLRQSTEESIMQTYRWTKGYIVSNAWSSGEFSSKRKSKAPYRLFCSLVLVYASHQKVIRINKDDSRIDSRLLVLFSCANRLDLFLSRADTGERRQKVPYFAWDWGLFVRILAKGKRYHPVISWDDRLRHISWATPALGNLIPSRVREGQRYPRDFSQPNFNRIVIRDQTVSECSERELVELSICHFFFLNPVASANSGAISPGKNHRGGNKQWVYPWI
jgi:hypothetical protein